MRKIVILLTVIFAYLVMGCAENNGAKREWGWLQEYESDYREKPFTKIEVLEKDDYKFLSLLDSDSSKRVWILLNPKYTPFYGASLVGMGKS